MVTINTNIPALTAARNIDRAQNIVSTSLERLGTGLRLNHSSDGPSEYAISERLKSRISALGTAQSNAEIGVSILQIAEGGMQSIADDLNRIRTLALQSANGSVTTADRAVMQNEVDGLVTEIDRVASTTEFNTMSLLNGDLASGTGDLNIQVGPDAGSTIAINIDDMHASTLGVNGLDISTQSAASAAISTVDSAINTALASQGEVGALQNRLESAVDQLSSEKLGHQSAQSVIADADFAQETTNLVRGQILTSTSSAALVQANLQSRNISDVLVEKIMLSFG